MLINSNFRRMYLIMSSHIRIKHVVFFFVCVFVLDYFGAFTHVFEADFFEGFDYPLEGDIRKYVEQLKNHDRPSVQPINEYNYSFISSCDKKCKSEDKLRLVYIVKSATRHFDRRNAIRNSWGYEKRFSDVPIRTIFLLGVNPEEEDLQYKIEQEQKRYSDIVQANFIDTYFNNTIKTMMGFKWAMQFCSNSKFYMFSDDDMYISTRNVLNFVCNPTQYPEYLIENVLNTPVETKQAAKKIAYEKPAPAAGDKNIHHALDFELPDDVQLFSGYIFFTAPHRHRSSKWHVSLSEYPYHMWPPYVTAGAYVLSHNALEDMYYASFFTKHFRFDDIYLGILAKKMDIEPFHSNEFYFYKKEYKAYNYRYVVASHGFDNPNELLHVWNEQRSAGYA